MNALLPSAVDGLLLGFVYGMAAMGLTLIFGVMRVVNLAHGMLIAAGMFTVLAATQAAGLSPYVGVLLAAVAGLGAGIVMYRLAVDRVVEAPELSTLLATYAVNLVVIGLATVTLTTSPQAVQADLGAIHVGDITVLGTHLVAVVVSCLAAAALYGFLYRTHAGTSVRAVAADRAAAELMGIDSRRMLAVAFGVGAALAMTGGALLATMFSFTVLSGDAYQTKSFVIVVLGGLGNPAGALLGGVVLGLLEGASTALIPVSWVPVLEYAVFVLVLLAWPNGLLGRRR